MEVMTPVVLPPTPPHVPEAVTTLSPDTPEIVQTPKPKTLDSVRFAAIAKQEAKLQMEREKLKIERESLTPLQEQIKAFEESKKQALLNPLKALEALGLTYDQLTDFVLNGGKPTAELQVSEVDRKLNEFRDEQKKERESQLLKEKEEIEKQEQQALATFRQEISDFIEVNKEKYELISLYGQQNEVFQLIADHAEKNERILSLDEASDLIEQELDKLVEKAISTKKYQAKAPPQPEVDLKQAKPPATSHRTITSQLTASQGQRPQHIAPEDRLKLAVQTYYALARK